jgi:D-alanine-D-alanine ligase
MGALTLGVVIPAGNSPRGARGGPDHSRAQSAEPSWTDAEKRSAGDLREAARTLGIACEVVAIPAFSDLAELELGPVTEQMSRCLADADLIMIAAHGRLGGSGQLHAAARACGLPVLGPSALAIELAFDKLRAREQLRNHNIPVPRTVVPTRASEAQLRRLGWPCVLKPRRGVAGVGMRRLDRPHTRAELGALLSQHGTRHELLLEREVAGREVSVVVLDGKVLGMAEIEHHGAGTTLICPPELDRLRRVGIENLARRACASLQLDVGAARVDMIVSDRGNEVVLEVEPLPPLHRDGLVARVARAAGLSYPRLCAQILGGPIAPTPGVRAPAPVQLAPVEPEPVLRAASSARRSPGPSVTAMAPA